MELSLVGLQNAGKSSLVGVLTTGKFQGEDTIPTVGFNMRKVTRGGVTIKMWDLGGQVRWRWDGGRGLGDETRRGEGGARRNRTGGRSAPRFGFCSRPPNPKPTHNNTNCSEQPRFRSLWERYCRGVQAIVFVVDAADLDGGALDASSRELAALCARPSLQGIPLLVLGNKADLPGALGTAQLIGRMGLEVRECRADCRLSPCSDEREERQERSGSGGARSPSRAHPLSFVPRAKPKTETKTQNAGRTSPGARCAYTASRARTRPTST